MKKITVIGLGYSDVDALSVAAYRRIFESDKKQAVLICRTQKHRVVEAMSEKGIQFETLDRFYESAESFDELNEKMAEYVMRAAEDNDVILCVAGSACVGDVLVDSLSKKCPEAIEVIAGQGAAENAFSVSKTVCSNGVCVIPAHMLEKSMINTRVCTCITDVDNKFLAGELKLKLLDEYPEDMEILYFYGHPDTKFQKIRLFELDRQKTYDFSVNFVIFPLDNFEKKLYDIRALLEIMRILRSQPTESSVGSLKFSEAGCSWDKEQDHFSIRQNMIEEAYEVVEAINNNDIDNMIEELGDTLLQVVFHSQIACETGEFTFSDVVNGVCEKLVRRHPHVFGDEAANDPQTALASWEKVKAKEKENKPTSVSLLSLPKDLPALMKALKVQSKTEKAGYPIKLSEEALNLADMFENAVNADNVAEMLFAVVNVCRKIGVDPDVELMKFTGEYSKEYIEWEQQNIKN